MRREGGEPCPDCLSTFHKLYILGQFGDGEGDPCPNFCKWCNLSKFGGGGGVKVIWTKSKRTATFFFGRPSLTLHENTDYNLSPLLILGVGRGNVASLHSGFAEKVEYLAGDASIWSDLTGSCKLPTKPCLLLRETTHLVPRALGLPFLLSLYQRCADCATATLRRA